MTIHIKDNNGTYLQRLESDSNPFKKGETIEIDVNGAKTSYGEFPNSNELYIIDEICHHIGVNYFEVNSIMNVDAPPIKSLQTTIIVKQI